MTFGCQPNSLTEVTALLGGNDAAWEASKSHDVILQKQRNPLIEVSIKKIKWRTLISCAIIAVMGQKGDKHEP